MRKSRPLFSLWRCAVAPAAERLPAGSQASKSQARGPWLRVLMAVVTFALLSGISTCHTSDCPAVDVDGNPIVAPCIQCSVPGRVPCMDNVWYLAEGSTCLEDQRPAKEDGTACDDGAGVCMAGVCAADGFPCTEQGVLDAIALGGGPHFFDCNGPTTVTTQAEIIIDNDVILDGEGNLIIDGNQDHRVLSIASGVTAELAGITVSGGFLDPNGDGAGIYNSGALTLVNSIVRDSQVQGNGDGCGVYNTGTLTLSSSAVLSNTGFEPLGCGIHSTGTLTLIDSSVSGNNAADGAQIAAYGSLILTNSTVVDDTYWGIYSVGTASLSNSTVQGGGLDAAIQHSSGTLTLISTTVTNSIYPAIGLQSGADLIVANSLILGDNLGPPACIVGAVTSLGGNIESPGDSCSFDQPADLVNVTAAELNLGPLADYGGPTMTRAMLPGSVAIDHVPASMCVDDNGDPLTTDQRDVARPQGVACDAGAFEWADCASAACEDGNVCTSYACNANTGLCQITPVPDGTPCSPAPQCDPGDGRCSVGVCESISGCGDLCFGVTCMDDGNDCTEDLCDPTTGLCGLPVPDGTSCAGGSGACISGYCDVCLGACEEGNPACPCGWDYRGESGWYDGRTDHAMVHIGPGKCVMFGGRVALVEFQDLWRYDVNTDWGWASPSNVPEARYGHAMAYVGDDKALMFGGYDSYVAIYGDTWVYDYSDDDWTPLTPPTHPAGRWHHGMTHIGDDKALLFGGHHGYGNWSSETWVYDLSDNAWTLQNPSTSPPAQGGEAMARIGDDKIMLLGYDNTWVYDLSDNNWTLMNPTVAPPSRDGARMAYVGNGRAVLFGGHSYQTPYGDTWIYDLSLNQWSEYTASPQPSARTWHAACETSLDGTSPIVIFSGATEYDPGCCWGGDTSGRSKETWTFAAP